MSDSNEMNTKPAHPKFLPPQSRKIADKGVRNTSDVCGFLSSLLADHSCERVTAEHATVSVKIVNAMLKTAELQYRYGKEQAGIEERKPLQLLSGK